MNLMMHKKSAPAKSGCLFVMLGIVHKRGLAAAIVIAAATTVVTVTDTTAATTAAE